MKLRHAAALALVGWYLMLPPISRDGVVHAEARLTNWLNIGAYDSANDCEAARLRVLDDPYHCMTRSTLGCAARFLTPCGANPRSALEGKQR
jgi:hypothetical protein